MYETSLPCLTKFLMKFKGFSSNAAYWDEERVSLILKSKYLILCVNFTIDPGSSERVVQIKHSVNLYQILFDLI